MKLIAQKTEITVVIELQTRILIDPIHFYTISIGFIFFYPIKKINIELELVNDNNLSEIDEV